MGITYSEAELTTIAEAANPLLPALGLPTLPVPTTLETVYGLVENPTVAGLLGIDPNAITPTVVEEAIAGLLGILAGIDPNLTLCYDISDTPFYEVQVGTGVGIGKQTVEVSIQVYPNPTKANEVVYFSEPIVGQLSLFNMQGQKVYEQNLNYANNIRIPDLAKGTYLLNIVNGKMRHGEMISVR